MASPIVTAAKAALVTGAAADAQAAAALDAQLRADARTALGPVLAGVNLTTLTWTVAPGNLVIVSDGTVSVAVRSDGTVWQVIQDTAGQWQQTGARLTSLLQLARQLSPAVIAGG